MAGVGVVSVVLVVLVVEVVVARRSGAVVVPGGIDGCAGCGSPAVPLRVAFLGDSTVAGVGAADAAGTLPRQVASRLGRPVQILDLAVSGARVADVPADQSGAGLASFRPEVVVVGVGANDVVHGTLRPDFRRHYGRLVASLPPGAQVILLGVPDLGSPPRLAQPLRSLVGWRGRMLDDDVRHLARDRHARFVDLQVFGPAFRRHPRRYFSPDRYHPSAAGYALWAGAVADAIAS
jgi:lysophospholipase L1-like esterase